MIFAKSSDDACRARYRDLSIDGVPVWFTGYFGFDGDKRFAPASVRPVAYLIEQDADTTLRSHFHVSDQFQIFVHGTGMFAKEPLREVTVHYARAYAPYGPIRAGGKGLSYFTLRNGPDQGPRFMPESRSELKSGFRPRRQFSLPAIERSAAKTLQAMKSVSCRALQPAEANGLGVWLYAVPPAATITGPSPSGSGGQYWLILSGELQTPDLCEGSCVFLPPEEVALTVTAGASGFEALVLQFENPTSA
jgi:hypothetical protein